VNTCQGRVDGQFVSDIVLDTGCTRTLVHRDLVSEGKLVKGEFVTIQCAHGDAVAYPLADVDLEIERRVVTVEAAVSETLPQSVLLGTDVPELLSLLGVKELGKALMVVTRSKARGLEKRKPWQMLSRRRKSVLFQVLMVVNSRHGQVNLILMMTCF